MQYQGMDTSIPIYEKQLNVEIQSRNHHSYKLLIFARFFFIPGKNTQFLYSFYVKLMILYICQFFINEIFNMHKFQSNLNMFFLR